MTHQTNPTTDRSPVPAGPPRTLPQLRAALAQLPMRFHLESDAPAGSVALGRLGEPPEAARLLDALRAARGYESRQLAKPALDAQLAVSAAVQSVAIHLLGSVLAAAVFHRVLLRADPADVHVLPAGPSVRVAVTGGEVVIVDRPEDCFDELAQRWVDGALRAMVDDLRRHHRVGEAMLWGNVASAAAATFVFLDWWDPHCDARRLAERFLRVGTPPLLDTVRLAELTVGGRTGLRSERSTCCLLDRLPAGHRCPTCPLSTEGERIEDTATHVQHLFAVRRGEAIGPPPRRAG
ncbi:MAG: (2Fe-2S)-binding protein [Acidimicrobiia bacterium]